ncbi:ATP-binding protein, partial [Streptomyces sp. T21Q-yed]|nr:ATP-binding protein [Streptomyces sp. T21Q-yed]
QGPDAAGGFPGDIAANPTGAGGESKEGPQSGGTGGSPDGNAIKSGLEKAAQPAPTSVSDNTNGQMGGSPGPGGSGANAASGQASGWQSIPPTTTPPPQGAPPSPGSQNATSSGPASPPPPPTGL